MTRHAPEPIGEEMVDAFFDRELNEDAKDQFFVSLRRDLAVCAEVAKTQRAISILREPIDAPDVSRRVLGELSRRRRFLPERLRRMVTAGRMMAAAIVLAFVLSIAIVDRVAPGMLRLTPRLRPVGNVVSCTSEETIQSVSQLANAIGAKKIEPESGPEPQEVATAMQGKPSRQVMVIQTLRAGVTSATLLPKPREGGLVLYRGSGADSRMALPEAVYIDKNAALLLPLGHISPSRVGSADWAGVSRDNLFLLPAIEPDVVQGRGAASKSRGGEAVETHRP